MEPVSGLKRARRALLSVTDKSGLADIATVMQSFDYDFVASGGTAAFLASHGIPHRSVSDLTGFPEIFGGRVKTLHPAIHGGILGAREEDFAAVATTGIAPIDVVCVNLYRFAEAARAGGSAAEVVEQIDVGGPAMLRAAAKNFARVTVLSAPADYEEFLWELRRHDGDTSLEFRHRMAVAAFTRTAAYDADIAAWFAGPSPAATVDIPLRYGENPHQAARLSVPGTRDLAGALGDCGLRLWGGKELSYNNLVDLVAALKLAADFPEGACAIIKHTNPCGLAVGDTPAAALERALACDPDAAFGGVYAFSVPLDEAAAELLAARFAEVVAAPAFPAGALEALRRRKNLRILTWERELFLDATRGSSRTFGRLRLAQDEDEDFPELDTATPAAGAPPADAVRAALSLAWRAVKHVKSNAVVLADATGLRGVGAGQMSRVDAVRLALHKARERGFESRGAVAASDGFFPFPDSIDLLADAGITAVIAPGGSVRDAAVAAAAGARGLTLIQAARRHFRH